MNSRLSTEQSPTDKIKAEARRLGFFACGVAEAAPVDGVVADRFVSWLRAGCHGGMEYMARHAAMRLDPRLLMQDVRSIVCVAMAYAPVRRLSETGYAMAAYAYGRDYHDVMKARLRLLAEAIGRVVEQSDAAAEGFGDRQPVATRVFCDTAPVLERYWAEKAGLGWTGRNRQLVIPGAGSMFFLGEVFVNRPLDYDSPVKARCGTCSACIAACPTGALAHARGLDARRCLSYLTIESREPVPPELTSAMGNCIYGCDRCLEACPWNRFSPVATEPSLQPSPELMAMRKADWHCLTIEEYRRLFKGSAVKRAKYEGLMRNIRAVESCQDDAR